MATKPPTRLTSWKILGSSQRVAKKRREIFRTPGMGNLQEHTRFFFTGKHGFVQTCSLEPIPWKTLKIGNYGICALWFNTSQSSTVTFGSCLDCDDVCVEMIFSKAAKVNAHCAFITISKWFDLFYKGLENVWTSISL